MSQYGVFSGLYFPVFSPNKGTHGPEKTQYLNTFNFLESSSNVLKRNYQGKKILALPYIYIYIYIYLCSITIVHKRVLNYHIYRWKEQNNYIGEK